MTYPNNAKGLSGPSSIHFAISPSDDDDLAIIPRAIYCQVAGDVVIRDAAGTTLTYTMTAGQVLPFRGTRILLTGTNATVYGWE